MCRSGSYTQHQIAWNKWIITVTMYSIQARRSAPTYLVTSIAETCSRCGLIENDAHLLFKSNFARAVWFASSTGLRAHGLPLLRTRSTFAGCHLDPTCSKPSYGESNIFNHVMPLEI